MADLLQAPVDRGRPAGERSLGDTFAAMEEAISGARKLPVTEYSIGQTTLEQIFNQFAGAKSNPEST